MHRKSTETVYKNCTFYMMKTISTRTRRMETPEKKKVEQGRLILSFNQNRFQRRHEPAMFIRMRKI